MKSITDFITGHMSKLRNHGFKLGLFQSWLCRGCNEPNEKETSRHLIDGCEAFERWRWTDPNAKEPNIIKKITAFMQVKRVINILDGKEESEEDEIDGNLSPQE